MKKRTFNKLVSRMAETARAIAASSMGHLSHGEVIFFPSRLWPSSPRAAARRARLRKVQRRALRRFDHLEGRS